MESLHPRIRLLWIARGAVVAIVLGVVLAAADQFAEVGQWRVDVPMSVIVGVVALGLVLGAVYALRLYHVWRFELQDDALYLERGVVTFVETAVPFVRVQHVDTQFGPIERALGLSSVVVYTAGSRNADVRIPGLTPDRARSLQDTLRELAVESEAEDAV
ncbi:PH domain-containing protein [Natrinema sp. 1APR25-10V2]|uniref:PH domain-containing protein n=1 Tax=Natrinema sp. 1APR25-10V2 TaxID=2951081 RepID=UPI0028745D62|nr:PH domain-containing protein [Natrinema sp. 1APR25-10V2]MDS0477392.1 PH domain-containing protein [Natrinema sp. 1APR25-10V2]